MRRKGKLDAVPQGGAVAPQEDDGSEMEEEVDSEQIEGVHQYMQLKTGWSNFC